MVTAPTRPGAADVPVERIMTRRVVTLPPDATIDTLVETLLANGLSRIPVVSSDGSVLGIATKTDVLEEQQDLHLSRRGGRAGASALHRAAGGEEREEDLRVRDVMTWTPVNIRVGASVAEAARLMAQHHLHGLPVLDDGGHLVGVVSSLDVLAWLAALK